jgi:hypothetical protein
MTESTKIETSDAKTKDVPLMIIREARADGDYHQA